MGIEFLTALAAYKPGGNITPEENFCTEVLCFLLKYSQLRGTSLLMRFLKKLDLDTNPNQYLNFRIGTQRSFESNGLMVRPDLYIENSQELILIEIKVGSRVNSYAVVDDAGFIQSVNQLKNYRRIQTSKRKSIYLLRKTGEPLCESELACLTGTLKWQDLYEMLRCPSDDPVEKFFFRDFSNYMEVRSMALGRVGYELKSGLDSVLNLMNQLDYALDGIKAKYNAGSRYIGYLLYADEKAKDYCAWVGVDFDEKVLVFQIPNPVGQQFLKTTGITGYEEYGDGIATIFNFENHFFCLGAEEQQKVLREWIQQHFRAVVSYTEGNSVGPKGSR